eukprot:3941891-Rhodomonas_salina.2
MVRELQHTDAVVHPAICATSLSHKPSLHHDFSYAQGCQVKLTEPTTQIWQQYIDAPCPGGDRVPLFGAYLPV